MFFLAYVLLFLWIYTNLINYLFLGLVALVNFILSNLADLTKLYGADISVTGPIIIVGYKIKNFLLKLRNILKNPISIVTLIILVPLELFFCVMYVFLLCPMLLYWVGRVIPYVNDPNEYELRLLDNLELESS